MKSIFRFFGENHLLSTIVTFSVLGLGLLTLFQINRSTLPNVDLGWVVINTYYPGASPEDVELNVTNKIEKEIQGISGIKGMYSTSMENISYVSVEIESDVPDPDKVKSEIREAVAQVTDLPEAVTENPRITEITSAKFPILEIGMAGPTIPYEDLREYARRFEKKLKEIKGIASIQMYGYKAREVKVEIDPVKIKEYQIPLREIIGAIQSRNIRATGGNLESYTSEKNVVTLAQFKEPEQVGDVIIRSSFDGPLVRVKDLAIIKDGFEKERVFPRVNGKQAISFQITKAEKGDVIRTTEAIMKLVEEEKKYLPEGIEFVFTNNNSKYVKDTFEVVITNLLYGLLFVLIILALFLNIKSAFWVALGIPFSLLGAIILIPFFGVDLDTITLTSLVLVIGIIVDDAIIVTEVIFQYVEKGYKPIDAMVEGLHSVYKPLIVTVTTTLVAFAPMFFMKGMLGKFIYVIPLAITLSLVVSLFESMFLLPAHILPGLKKIDKLGIKKSPSRGWFNPVKKIYSKMMLSMLRLRYLWVVVGILILGGSLFYAATKMDFILFPSKGAEVFYGLVELPIGSSLNHTSDKMKEIEEIINNLPEGEVESYVVKVGSYAGEVDTESENYATITVYLSPYSKRRDSGLRVADSIVEDVRNKSNSLEGFKKITFDIDSGGPPVGKPIAVRIVGTDDALRRKFADDIEAFLKTQQGVKDIDRDDKLGKEQIELKIDFTKLSRLGLTVQDITSNVRIAYDGQIVTSVRYGDEDVEFRVIVDEKSRKSLIRLMDLTVPNNQGRLIPIKSVLTFNTGPGTTMIRHYDSERAVNIVADLDKKLNTPKGVMDNVMKHFDGSLEYPGMRLIVGGEAEEEQKAMIQLGIMFIIAAFGIYCMLILLFNSLAQPLIVLTSIPFGISGVIIAFVLHNETLGFMAMIGIIGMAGVVVNDSLVMVDHLNGILKQNKNEAGNPIRDVREVIAEGAGDRLRAILLTTLTTVSGMIPLVYGIGGESIFMGPMAMALGYGLLFATPITLILVPSMYLIGYDFYSIGKGIKGKFQSIVSIIVSDSEKDTSDLPTRRKGKHETSEELTDTGDDTAKQS